MVDLTDSTPIDPPTALQGCGHIAHEEDPVTFADHVAHFAAGNVAADSVDSVDAG